jgi:hypothetical protein
MNFRVLDSGGWQLVPGYRSLRKLLDTGWKKENWFVIIKNTGKIYRRLIHGGYTSDAGLSS